MIPLIKEHCRNFRKQLLKYEVWNGLPISTPPYTICAKCNYDKCVPIDYVSKRGFHHVYKDI